MEAAIRATIEALKEEIPHEAPAPLCCRALRRKPDELLRHHRLSPWRTQLGRGDWRRLGDLKIAEDTLVAGSRERSSSLRPQKPRFCANLRLPALGRIRPQTPAHRNLLDADTRFPKLVRVAIRVLRRVIRMLLAKHPK